MAYNNFQFTTSFVEELLLADYFTDSELGLILALKSFPDNEATTPELAAKMGYKGFGGVNLIMGNLAKRWSFYI